MKYALITSGDTFRQVSSLDDSKAASKVIEMRFKVFVSSSAVSLLALLVGIVPKTKAAVRMTHEDYDLVV